MKLLRGIRNLPGAGTQVTIDPLLHLSRRIVWLEQPDHPVVGSDGFENVIEDQFPGGFAFTDLLCAKLLHNSNHGGFLEELANG